MNALKRALRRKTPFAPAKTTIKFQFKRVFDPEGEDGRLLAAAFNHVKFLDTEGNVLLRINIGTKVARKYMGWGWSGNENWMDDTKNIVWAGTKLKYATLHLDLPRKAKYMRIRILQIDRQVTTIYLDSKLLIEIPADYPWKWITHLIEIQ